MTKKKERGGLGKKEERKSKRVEKNNLKKNKITFVSIPFQI